ncbi:hypothetical protein [Bacteroides mediterraneensis]|uniref:Uncharacterized protein n=1 Tax=Bacteroides mediterraneensis TaxID=1841856 RepID=A0ABS2EVY0_9BACE|nr:hypothetical protein [Bacteroides mediterraneensis]MBM6758822.1 hypothetical protein [Bacteroides mediterraneensis]
MKNQIINCIIGFKENTHCQLSPTCKGWGCRFLTTPIEEIPVTDQEKAKLFSKVYREAKRKGVLECPHYRSMFIDEVLENIEIN